MSFYEGRSLYDVLTKLNVKLDSKKQGSSIVKFISNNSGNRTYFVENNKVNYSVGDYLRNVYTNEIAKIKKFIIITKR